MLHLYNEKPISIFTIDSDAKIRVQFCNVKMKMKPCQLKHFHKYLTNLSKKWHPWRGNKIPKSKHPPKNDQKSKQLTFPNRQIPNKHKPEIKTKNGGS